jgi:Domain of unknown function (DUF5668)
MRVDSGYLGWGIFFVAAGAVALAVGQGLVPDQRWWTYWPLILVGVGIALVLRGTSLEVLGGSLVAATFGIIVGGTLATGVSGFGDVTGGVCRVGEGGPAFAERTGTLGGSASVGVELDCGRVEIAAVPGSAWTVRGNDEDGRGPDIQAETDELDIQPPDGTSGPASWQIQLPTDPILDVELQLNAGQLQAELAGASLAVVDLEVNAGQAILDLTGVEAVEGIDVGVNAGEVGVTLPSRAMTGGIEVNAGSVRLCAPDDVALRLETQVVLGAVDAGDSGLVEVEGGWETPGYDTAPTRIELRIQANLGSVRVDPTEGCA